MTSIDQSFWQARYDEGTTQWNLGAISSPLKAYVDQLDDKSLRILIPGCGYGHEAIYLAGQGFTNVTVIDLVDNALQLIREKAPSVHCITGDFFAHTGTYDRILEQTLFCAIDPVLREPYIAHVAKLLADGGKYAGVLFNREFEEGPPFGGSTAEYEGYLKPHFSSFQLEECYNSIERRQGTEVFARAVK
jgi:SAM-dependent methyltransferase